MVQVLALSERSSLVLALTMLVPDWEVDAVADVQSVRAFGQVDVLIIESPTTAAGLATAAEIRTELEALPVVVVGDVVPDGHAGPEVLLSRPFTVAELRDRILELLGMPVEPEPEPEPEEPGTAAERLLARFRRSREPSAPPPPVEPGHAHPDLLQIIDLASVESPEAPSEPAEPAPATSWADLFRSSGDGEPSAPSPEPPAAEEAPDAAPADESAVAETAPEPPAKKRPKRRRPAPPAPRHHLDPTVLAPRHDPDPSLLDADVDADATTDDDVPDVIEVLGGYERTEPIVIPEPEPAPAEAAAEADAAPDDDVVELDAPEPPRPDPLDGADRELRALMAELVNAFDPVTAAIWVQDDEHRWHAVEHLGLRPAEARRVVAPEQPMFAALARNLHGVLLSPADLARGYLAGAPGTWTEDIIASAVGSKGRCLAIVVVGGEGYTPRSTRRLVALAEYSASRLAPYDPAPPRRRRLLALGRR